MKNKTENTSTLGNIIESVKTDVVLRVTDFVDNFKFRYRGKPYVWNNKEVYNIIEHDINLLESELNLGYITPY